MSEVEALPTHVGLSSLAIGSWHYSKDAAHLRNRFTMIQSVRKHPQGQDLDTVDRFLACLAIHHNPGQVRYLNQPATIVFLVNFDG